MILYIRALGFSEYNTKEKAEKLVGEVIADPTEKFLWETEDKKVEIEYYKNFGKDFGLLVRGYIGDDGEINVHSLIPSSTGYYMTHTQEVDVVYLEDQDVYHVFCEEEDSGTPISFFLQNIKEYQDLDDVEEIYTDGVRLSAYCVEGTVILPIDKDETDRLLEEEEEKIRKELLDQARKGDEEAMNILDEEALQASEMLQERLKSEDILSVLEGFYVPVGDEDDIYSILGNIEAIEVLTNQYTNEEIFRMKVMCMNIPMDLFVAKKDLMGYPTVGMRIKATCWMHGEIVFGYEDDDEI